MPNVFIKKTYHPYFIHHKLILINELYDKTFKNIFEFAMKLT